MDHTKKRRRAHGYVALTSAMTEILRQHRDRTGVSAPALARSHLDPALCIKPRHIHGWILGEAETARAGHYSAVLKAWQDLPSRDDRYVHCTPEVRAAMQAQRRRSGVGVYKLFKNAADMPAGLAFTHIRSFYDGRLRRLRRSDWEYVMAEWAALPDCPETLLLTPEIIGVLRGHAARLGKGPQALLRGVKHKPSGFTSTIASNWMSGRATRARKDHLEFLIARYEAAPSPALSGLDKSGV
jgi:hypothetical protein